MRYNTVMAPFKPKTTLVQNNWFVKERMCLRLLGFCSNVIANTGSTFGMVFEIDRYSVFLFGVQIIKYARFQSRYIGVLLRCRTN